MIVNKSDLTRLKKFITKNEKTITEYPILKSIYENDNFYAACDNRKLGVLFKDVNNKEFYKYSDSSKLDLIQSAVKILGQEIEDYKSYFVINRKQLLDEIEQEFGKMKLSAKAEHKKLLHKKDAIVILYLDIKHYKLYCDMTSDKEIGSTIVDDVDCKEDCYRDDFKIGVNLQYLMEFLEFFQDKLLKIQYFKGLSSLVSESDDRAALILPVRIEWGNNMDNKLKNAWDIINEYEASLHGWDRIKWKLHCTMDDIYN